MKGRSSMQSSRSCSHKLSCVAQCFVPCDAKKARNASQKHGLLLGTLDSAELPVWDRICLKVAWLHTNIFDVPVPGGIAFRWMEKLFSTVYVGPFGFDPFPPVLFPEQVSQKLVKLISTRKYAFGETSFASSQSWNHYMGANDVLFQSWSIVHS